MTPKESLGICGISNYKKGHVLPVLESIVLGRCDEADVFVDDLEASRRHTRFFRTESAALMVEDLNSSNGTFVNNTKIREAVLLAKGDIVRLGTTEFRIQPGPGPMAKEELLETPRLVKAVAAVKHPSLTRLPSHEFLEALGLTGDTLDTSYEDLQIKTRHFATLFEISTLIQSVTSPDAMLAACLDVILKVPGGDVAHVLMVDSDGCLKPRISKALDGSAVEDLQLSKTLSSYVIEHQCAVVAPDLQADLRFANAQSIQLGRTRSILAAPIIVGQDSKGLIALSSTSVLATEAEQNLDLLSVAAGLIGPALRTLDLQREIEETQREVVFTMGAIGETRSKETGNHVRRVAEYSKLLALQSGLGETQAELLKQASPMHDIGKVGIPDRVLNKPGKLDAEEWDVMKTHARLGFDMLNHSQRPILKAAAIVAHEHHEKWDGSGYPRGLKDTEIHIYGRITAVADVFDALGSDRCYKKAWELERILELFREQRGTHFDPTLVDLLLENLPTFLEIREQYRDGFMGT